MGTSYDPRRSDYVDEMAVRHESARVFDVCMSCQKCLNACSVFPLLVSSVDECVEREAALLTPSQQDEIVNLCHQCTQCVAQCPYADAPAGEAVNFPALVIRHRAMLRKNKFLTLREQVKEDVVALSATHASWGRPFQVFGARLLRSVTVHVPTLFAQRHSVRQKNASHNVSTTTCEVSYFPTCVVDAYAPEVANATQKVFAQVGAQCVRGKEHNCCGAPDLYNGNIKRFRRIVRKNVRAFRAALDKSQRIVVGQPGCLHVMREHYAVFSDDPVAADVVAHLQDSWEFLATIETPENTESFHPTTADRSLVLLQSSMAMQPGETDHARGLLEKWGWDVHAVSHISLAETVWELRRDHIDQLTSSTRELSDLVAAAGDAAMVGHSCLTNRLLAEQIQRPVRHPIEVLAENGRRHNPK
jgi:glycerol-3-phosphate dehydrogenase subunit C